VLELEGLGLLSGSKKPGHTERGEEGMPYKVSRKGRSRLICSKAKPKGTDRIHSH